MFDRGKQYRRRTAIFAGVLLCGFLSGPSFAAAEKIILFLGDSITAGYGLDPSRAYPALIEEKINARKWPFKVINAGQSGDTSAGGLSRLDWLLKHRIDVLVLELGANDGLRGLPVEATKRNLQAIIDRTRAKYPEAKMVIAGMMVPPNMGRDYGKKFSAIFAELAEKNHAALIPFLLEKVGGVRDLNLPDGIHPSAKGHEIVADNVWRVLEPILRSLADGPRAAPARREKARFPAPASAPQSS
ncbi:MAG TPA: arylesterase [Methylomirabilota bacterium]|nr:arylesterase [Methylomirabilota bacterium]